MIWRATFFFNGIVTSYGRWIWHGEGTSSSTSVNLNGASLGKMVRVDDNNEDDVAGMVNDVQEELLDHHDHTMQKMLIDNGYAQM